MVKLDVTDTDDIAMFSGALARDGVRPGPLVNNAGHGAMGPVIEMPLVDVGRQHEVNVSGLLALTQRLAEPMIDAGSGTIVNIGSTPGVLTTPFAGVYCSTKSAVHALADAMRMESAPSGSRSCGWNRT